MSEKRNDPVLEKLSPADRARFLDMVKKGISRRDFMHYMMAAGATAAASGTLFTGVSDAWANTPKRGGRVVFARCGVVDVWCNVGVVWCGVRPLRKRPLCAGPTGPRLTSNSCKCRETIN